MEESWQLTVNSRQLTVDIWQCRPNGLLNHLSSWDLYFAPIDRGERQQGSKGDGKRGREER